MRYGGRLTAEGTADQPITFTGKEQLKGYWGGLQFLDSNSTDNRLVHVVVSYGGSETFDYIDDPGNVVASVSGGDSNTRVTLEEATITHSAGYGVVTDDGSTVASCTNVTFEKNDSGDTNDTCPTQ
jgi:hypothetical protein